MIQIEPALICCQLKDTSYRHCGLPPRPEDLTKSYLYSAYWTKGVDMDLSPVLIGAFPLVILLLFDGWHDFMMNYINKYFICNNSPESFVSCYYWLLVFIHSATMIKYLSFGLYRPRQGSYFHNFISSNYVTLNPLIIFLHRSVCTFFFSLPWVTLGLVFEDTVPICSLFSKGTLTWVLVSVLSLLIENLEHTIVQFSLSIRFWTGGRCSINGIHFGTLFTLLEKSTLTVGERRKIIAQLLSGKLPKYLWR